VLLAFTADHTVVEPGESVTFSWDVRGAVSNLWLLAMAYSYGAPYQVNREPLPASGTLTYAPPSGPYADDKYVFWFVTGDSPDGYISAHTHDVQGPASNRLLISFRCDTPLFFSLPASWDTQANSTDTCGDGAAVAPLATMQLFEHGLMIRFGNNPKKVYVLAVQPIAGYSNGPWRSVDDSWTEGEPESDPSLMPPDGRYQPVKGFGKIWSGLDPTPGDTYPRASLGWALAPEQTFVTSFQRGRTTGNLYFRDGQGQVIMLTVDERHGARPHWQPLTTP
jgi:hypothetical protein